MFFSLLIFSKHTFGDDSGGGQQLTHNAGEDAAPGDQQNSFFLTEIPEGKVPQTHFPPISNRPAIGEVRSPSQPSSSSVSESDLSESGWTDDDSEASSRGESARSYDDTSHPDTESESSGSEDESFDLASDEDDDDESWSTASSASGLTTFSSASSSMPSDAPSQPESSATLEMLSSSQSELLDHTGIDQDFGSPSSGSTVVGDGADGDRSCESTPGSSSENDKTQPSTKGSLVDLDQLGDSQTSLHPVLKHAGLPERPLRTDLEFGKSIEQADPFSWQTIGLPTPFSFVRPHTSKTFRKKFLMIKMLRYGIPQQ